MKIKPKWTSEPWQDPIGPMPPGVAQVLGPAHWGRAKVCVNACAGRADPATDFKRLEENNEDLLRAVKMAEQILDRIAGKPAPMMRAGIVKMLRTTRTKAEGK